MQKNVSAGENIATVALDGTECAVSFDAKYPYFYICNSGGSDIYAGVKAGITAGEDGVVTVPAGSICPVIGGFTPAGIKAADTVYILGSGNVQITASRFQINFKQIGKGGGSVQNIMGFPALFVPMEYGAIEFETE